LGADFGDKTYENAFVRTFCFGGRFRRDGGAGGEANPGRLQSGFEGVVGVWT
jgi:hypothetical protein